MNKHFMENHVKVKEIQIRIFFIKNFQMIVSILSVWLCSVSFGLCHLTSPPVVAVCRRHSPRLLALAGSLLCGLACLFISFSTEPHQVFISYSVVFAIASGMVEIHQFYCALCHSIQYYAQSDLAFISNSVVFASGMLKIYHQLHSGLCYSIKYNIKSKLVSAAQWYLLLYWVASTPRSRSLPKFHQMFYSLYHNIR